MWGIVWGVYNIFAPAYLDSRQLLALFASNYSDIFINGATYSNFEEQTPQHFPVTLAMNFALYCASTHVFHFLWTNFFSDPTDPLWKARAEIVSGEREVEGVNDAPVKGVPRFWATVLQNNEMLMEAFGQKDLDILEYLYDI